MNHRRLLAGFVLLLAAVATNAAPVEVASLAELARAAAQDGGEIRLKPGVYRMADYLTEPVLADIRAGFDRKPGGRPPVPMFVFRGNDNRIDCTDAVLEIDTTLYRLLPQGGYTRCLILAGAGNTITGLAIRNTGPDDRGSGGNILSIAGARNTIEDVTLHVRGSFPYGYGDLLGKGGPNLVPLQKQSGIQVLGERTTLRRCRVFCRALGHCFYFQGGDDVQVEDCYAEGEMRATTAMLRDTSGPAFERGFPSVYENRDGRYRMVAGYTKSLVEDGFRTYGSAGSVTLVNCTAVNTRAGFEIGAKDDAPRKTVIENCVARGCERAFLIGSQTIVRRSRGDVQFGPLLYLRGGRESEVELELADAPPATTVHALATIAGSGHRVRLSLAGEGGQSTQVPILLGFGMPAHAEMASPILPAATTAIDLVNTIPHVPVFRSAEAKECRIETPGRVIDDTELRKSPGKWGP